MATEATEDGSAKQSRHRVPTVLAGARIGRLMAGHVRQAERVIKLAAGRPSGVGGDSATVERELQAAVEIEPKRHLNRFTRRARHMPRPVNVHSSDGRENVLKPVLARYADRWILGKMILSQYPQQRDAIKSKIS